MRKTNDTLDVARLFLSLVVVGIHIAPFGSAGGFPSPLARTAVPIFFLISSFLFYSRPDGCDSKALARFLLRNGRRYLCWFLLLFPVTAWARGYFSGDVRDFLGNLVTDLLFGSTFRGSWFLSALCIGMGIVFFLSKYLGDWSALSVGGILYGVCCLSGNYAGAFGDGSWFSWYPGAWYTSFPAAVLWIALGRCIARRQDRFSQLSLRTLLLLLGVSLLLLLGEDSAIAALGIRRANDCYFSLVLLCPAVFFLLLRCSRPIPRAARLRPFAAVIYFLHGALGLVLDWGFRKVGMDPGTFPISLLLYGCTVGICVAAAGLFLWLSGKPGLSRIRYLL